MESKNKRRVAEFKATKRVNSAQLFEFELFPVTWLDQVEPNYYKLFILDSSASEAT